MLNESRVICPRPPPLTVFDGPPPPPPTTPDDDDDEDASTVGSVVVAVVAVGPLEIAVAVEVVAAVVVFRRSSLLADRLRRLRCSFAAELLRGRRARRKIAVALARRIAAADGDVVEGIVGVDVVACDGVLVSLSSWSSAAFSSDLSSMSSSSYSSSLSSSS